MSCVSGLIARERLHRVAARDIELVRAFDHVRAGRDDVAPVVAGLLEAPGDLFRDRARRSHRQAIEEIAGRLRQLEDDRLVVGRGDAGDRLGLAVSDVCEALDHLVVERIAEAPDIGVRKPVESELDVRRSDLPAHRRPEHDPVLQGEGVGETVVRDLRHVGGEVGVDLVPRVARRSGVAHELPDDQVVEAPSHRRVLGGRVEVGREVERGLDVDPVGPARCRPFRDRIVGPGLGRVVVVASARHDGERQHSRQRKNHCKSSSSHVTPFLPFSHEPRDETPRSARNPSPMPLTMDVGGGRKLAWRPMKTFSARSSDRARPEGRRRAG